MVERLGQNGNLQPFHSVLDEIDLIVPITEGLSAKELRALEDTPSPC